MSQEAVETYIDLRDQKIVDVWTGAESSRKGQRYPWYPYPLTRAKKIWSDYMRMGFVRDERGVEDMAEDFLHKIAAIDAITVLAGHTPSDPRSVIREFELRWSEKTDDKLPWYITDEKGSWRLSDYALPKLQDHALHLLDAQTAEEKILILDAILNVVHQRSDLASWFVHGGRRALDSFSA